MVPVGAAGFIEQDNGGRGGLAGLDEGEKLKALIHRAEAARKQYVGLGLLHEHDLAGEEVFEVDELRIIGDVLVGRRLERQHDVHAERLIGTRSFVTRFHDARSGTGDDHPVFIGDLTSEVLGALIRRLARLDPG